MKRVLTAVLLIPVVLLIVFKAPLWLFALVVAAIIVLALHEYLGIVEAAGIKPFRMADLRVEPAANLVVLVHRCRTSNPARAILAFIRLDASLLQSWWILIALAPVIFGIPLVFRKDLRWRLGRGRGISFLALFISASPCRC